MAYKYDELQMSNAIQNLSLKANYKKILIILWHLFEKPLLWAIPTQPCGVVSIF
jgi:hypothetical protein